MRSQLFVPLLTYPDPTSTTFTEHAAALAKYLGADIVARVVDIDIKTPSAAFGGLFLDVPKMVAEAEDASRADGEVLKAAIETEAGKAGVAVTTEVKRFHPEEACPMAAVEARYYDLSAIGWEPHHERAYELAESLVFDSGRPVVLLPDASNMDRLGHIAVAWDGSRAAARALADAAPLLAKASAISVIMAIGDKALPEENIAEHLVLHLKDRGLEATSHVVDASADPTGGVIQRRALELGAGLLVMGGYGHSKLREFTLGGVTRDILTDLRLPVLFSH